MLRIIFHGTLILALTFAGCREPASSQDKAVPLYETSQFKTYWYAGKAELDAYALDQSRYGENHQGEAVLIFVTEPFSKKKQVKLDNPETAGNDKVNVLKLNFTKKFVTGIYPYSMMLSVFTPINRSVEPNTLKVTMSSQEWCGHVYEQMNLKGNQFNVESHSYFEQEGDQIFQLKRAILEDELWNIIRTDPNRLPMGSIDLIPGLFFMRLHHYGSDIQSANASQSENADGSVQYKLEFPEIERTLNIRYEGGFPYKILGWVEEFTAPDGKIMRTTATLKKTLVIDYWRKNKKQFRYLRDSLGLSN
jgi:hypothetical protein